MDTGHCLAENLEEKIAAMTSATEKVQLLLDGRTENGVHCVALIVSFMVAHQIICSRIKATRRRHDCRLLAVSPFPAMSEN